MQIDRLLKIMIESELNCNNKYEAFRDEEDKTRKTLLHYAAELGYLYVTKTLTDKCPVLLTMKTEQAKGKKSMLAVELALVAENDEVAAYLIRVMWHERYNA